MGPEVPVSSGLERPSGGGPNSPGARGSTLRHRSVAVGFLSDRARGAPLKVAVVSAHIAHLQTVSFRRGFRGSAMQRISTFLSAIRVTATGGRMAALSL